MAGIAIRRDLNVVNNKVIVPDQQRTSRGLPLSRWSTLPLPNGGTYELGNVYPISNYTGLPHVRRGGQRVAIADTHDALDHPIMINGKDLYTFLRDPVYGYALQFDGVQNYVNTVWLSTITPAVYTIEARIQFTTALERGVFDTLSAAYTIFVLNGRIYFNDAPFVGQIGPTTTDVNDGRPHDIAVTADGVTKRIFVDGILEAEGLISGTPVMGSVIIGRLDRTGETFDGVIDNVRISNVCRWISDYVPETPQVDVNTVALWKFDEGEGAVAEDSSGNGHTGLLSGDPLPEWVNAI